MNPDRIHVVIGVIKNNSGQVLIAHRSSDIHQGGLWEFPGGKLELGEDVNSALRRELQEELGLIIEDCRPLIKLQYDYPEEKVLLDVWQINKWHGELFGREGQVIKWVNIHTLKDINFPVANKNIIKALELPCIYFICPEPGNDIKKYIDKIEKCIEAGINYLQLRCSKKTYLKYPHLVNHLLDKCNHYQVKLLLNTSPGDAVSQLAHGVHLSSARLLQLNQRPLDSNYVVAASCHNLNELTHASRINLDFAVLSPVEKTVSHPEAEPLGWNRFKMIVDHSNIPVYALGGMQPNHLQKSWKHGAQGLAMLSGIWLSKNPEKVIRSSLLFN